MSDSIFPPPPPPVVAPKFKTVRMYDPDTGKAGDIHPAEVDNMKSHGWRLATEAPPPPPEVGMSDADLRKAIFDATGERPGPNTKRETLLEKFNTARG